MTNAPLSDDNLFHAESQRVDRELEAAQQMLIHVQREEELQHRRKQAQEVRRRSQNIASRTMDETSHDRYATSNAHNAHTAAASSSRNSAVEQQVYEYKNKVKTLNPLRRARKTHAYADRSNNPNIPGEDNGHNAWMDVTLNEDVDTDIQIDARYAKKNSESNRFYDIDDIPIRGPPRRYDIPHDISVEDAMEAAKFLMNNANLVTCSKTGMMIPKKPRRTPTSTVTRVDRSDQAARFNTRSQQPRHDGRHDDNKRSCHDKYQ